MILGMGTPPPGLKVSAVLQNTWEVGSHPSPQIRKPCPQARGRTLFHARPTPIDPKRKPFHGRAPKTPFRRRLPLW